MNVSHQGHLERAEVGQYVEVPLQDSATTATGYVVEADVSFFVVELESVFPGDRLRLDQGHIGVRLVSDG